MRELPLRNFRDTVTSPITGPEYDLDSKVSREAHMEPQTLLSCTTSRAGSLLLWTVLLVTPRCGSSTPWYCSVYYSRGQCLWPHPRGAISASKHSTCSVETKLLPPKFQRMNGAAWRHRQKPAVVEVVPHKVPTKLCKISRTRPPR
jgi:hypothetical protein